MEIFTSETTMLVRAAIFASIAVLAATQVPRLYERLETRQATTAAPETGKSPAMAVMPQGRVNLKADQRGHFIGAFKINGKPVEGLVDTGASTVAINESTARRLGIVISSLDFRYKMGTANGITEAASVTLDRIEIGSLRVRDVEAFVLRDKSLKGTLVGMSFLRKLKSYEARADGMTLVQ